jgi:hypothetical protein
MDFKKATDVLCEAITAADIARALKKPEQSIRQARANPEGAGYRPPPSDWRDGVIKLAESRAKALQRLADQLKRDG